MHVLKSLFDSLTLYCGYSKESSQWDDSFEYPQHRVCFNNKREIVGKVLNTPPYLDLCLIFMLTTVSLKEFDLNLKGNVNHQYIYIASFNKIAIEPWEWCHLELLIVHVLYSFFLFYITITWCTLEINIPLHLNYVKLNYVMQGKKVGHKVKFRKNLVNTHVAIFFYQFI